MSQLKTPVAGARRTHRPLARLAAQAPARCSLCALRTRCPATIHALASADPGQVRYLATLGLLPRATIEVEERAPFDGPLLVKVGGARYALGRDVADGIIVTPS